MPYKGDTLFQSLGTCALGFFFIPLGLFAEMSTRTYRNEYDVLIVTIWDIFEDDEILF